MMILLKRLWFTIGLLLTLSFFAWLTGNLATTLPGEWLARVGISVADLLDWRWERLISAALLTHGGQILWEALGMVLVGVGAAEWLTGARRTFLTFWGVHLATLLLETGILISLASFFATLLPTALLITRDVGPSAGCFDCLGLAIRRLPRRPQGWLGSGILGVLLLVCFLPTAGGEAAAIATFANLAHLLAFPLGWGSAYWHNY